MKPLHFFTLLFWEDQRPGLSTAFFFLRHYIWLGVIMLSIHKYVFILLFAFSISLRILFNLAIIFFVISLLFCKCHISTLSAVLVSKVWQVHGYHFHNIPVDVRDNFFRAIKPALTFNFFCLARHNISPIQSFSVLICIWTFIQKENLCWNQDFFWNLFCSIFSPSLCQQTWVKRRG